MTRIRVLHVYKTALPISYGGVETFMDSLCKATASLGVENTVFALAKRPTQITQPSESYRLVLAKENLHLASTGFSASAFPAFYHLAKEADVIQYHFPNPFSDLLNLACRIKKPSIVTYHSDIIKQRYLSILYRPLMKQFFNQTQRIIATSPNYVATSPVLSQFANKISVIPVGIQKNAIEPASEERLTYWKKQLPQPFFLFVGALRYYKGLSYAIEAVKGTSINLVVAGGGGISETLLRQAKNEPNIFFTGRVTEEDKAALLQLCYGFVFPSHLRSEAFGLSMLEAAAFQKPLICCEIGTGTSFVNANQETGLVVEPQNPNAIKNAMEYLLNHPKEAEQFGINAEKRLETVFSLDKCARDYHHLYRAVL